MIVNKEAELTSAVMLYAIRCLVEGDQAALREMNFGPREVQALREMNLSDLCYVETLRTHCLSVALDREVYWPLLSQLRQRRESEELQQALISADAPLEMMQTFFGMSGREYARLRRMLVVNSATGRPPEASEEQTQTIWDAWQARREQLQDGLLPPEEYLSIHQDSGIPLRTIWGETRRWADYE
jgi:hypothetical protein